MGLWSGILGIVLHLDEHLGSIIGQYGLWTYAILFLIIFLETGLVIMPFLPGDSLLFAAGAITAATGALNVWLLFLLLASAAILGDTLNYWMGHYFGAKIFLKRGLIQKKYLDKTHDFYEKHGGKTLILARFVPIIRTFAPFVAGIGKMDYGKFISFNVIGGILWVALFVFGGFLFGNIPFVKENFVIAILGIIVVSVVPILFEVAREAAGRFRKGRAKRGKK